MCLYFLIFFSSDIGLLPIIVLVRSCLLYPLLLQLIIVDDDDDHDHDDDRERNDID